VNEDLAQLNAAGRTGGVKASPPEPLLLREPVVVVWLSAIALLFFLLTHFLVQASQHSRQDLAETWAREGRSALSSHDATAAAADFRNALLYAPDNPQHRLHLAQALLADGRNDEAQLYLRSLWEDEPANGRVNLELARLAVFHHDVADALRFYHGAIYGLWDDETASHRRDVRLELIAFLLREKFPTLARSELIALEPDVAADPAAQGHVAALYSQAGDEESALRVYQKRLRVNSRDPEALAGAGDAAYQLGRYVLAQQYLQRAVAEAPNDARSRERLEVCDLILQLDPYQPGLAANERAAHAAEAFRQAGVLLESCAASEPDEVRAHWSGLKPSVAQARLRSDAAFFGQTMSTVAEVARSAGSCETEAPLQKALLAVAKEGEETR
jgi:Tfp pilus assembly protein PilF